MQIVYFIVAFAQTFLFLVIISFALLYAVVIINLRQLKRANNILTLNICIITMICCFSWIPVTAVFMFDNSYEIYAKIHPYFNVPEMLFTTQMPFCFVVTSVHCYGFVVFHQKNFFRSQRWVVCCIGCQWLIGFILVIPIIACANQPCEFFLWSRIYTFLITVVIPSIVCMVMSGLIYRHVRSSSRRLSVTMGFTRKQRKKFSQRDILLLRHMVFMFSIFIVGWAPVFINNIVEHYVNTGELVKACLIGWCEVATLIDMIDLFWYNREARRCLKCTCFRRI